MRKSRGSDVDKNELARLTRISQRLVQLAWLVILASVAGVTYVWFFYEP